MRMRHNEEFQPKVDDDGEVTGLALVTEMPRDTLAGGEQGGDGDDGNVAPLEGFEETPPQLDVEDRKTARRPVILDEQGNDITDRPEVQQLIASGEIEFREGEQIILVDQPPTEAEIAADETTEDAVAADTPEPPATPSPPPSQPAAEIAPRQTPLRRSSRLR